MINVNELIYKVQHATGFKLDINAVNKFNIANSQFSEEEWYYQLINAIHELRNINHHLKSYDWC